MAARSPRNWNLQGPGIGFEVMGGAAAVIWPEVRIIAYAAFSIGTILIVWPIVSWAASVLTCRIGIRAPIYPTPATEDSPAKRELVGAMLTILVALGISGFIVYELIKASNIAAIQENKSNELEDATSRARGQLTRLETIGGRLVLQEVTTDEDLGNWIEQVTRWEIRCEDEINRAVLAGVIPNVERSRFNRVTAPGLGNSYNSVHSTRRGHLNARAQVIREILQSMESE